MKLQKEITNKTMRSQSKCQIQKRHNTASLVMASTLSGVGAEVIVYAIITSILEYCHIDFTKDDILNIIPCKKTTE
jgi:hypothetical protein